MRSGIPQVVDGETIVIDYQLIKLHGIVAPNDKVMCEMNGINWPCGWEATNALTNFIGQHWVTCQAVSITESGKISAVCSMGNNIELNSWMVRNGWAKSGNVENTSLISKENLARKERLGLWR